MTNDELLAKIGRVWVSVEELGKVVEKLNPIGVGWMDRKLALDGWFRMLDQATRGTNDGVSGIGKPTTPTCESTCDEGEQADRAPNGADREKYNAYQREYKRRKRAQ